jgi:flagellar biosynthetic protein FlhB
MADDAGDKTEAPTPRKRQDAIDRGQVSKSQDLSAAAVLLASIVVLDIFGPGLMASLHEVVEEQLSLKSTGLLDPTAALLDALRWLTAVSMSLLPLLGSLVVLGVSANLAQVGFMFNTKRLEPKLSSLSPLKGLKKIFGGQRAIVQLAFNLLKLFIVGFIAWTAISDKMGRIVSAQGLEYMQILSLGTDIVYAVALRVAVALLVLALFDYAWQRFSFERDLKMTKQEVKDEMKRMEGDPQIKMRRRQIAMQTARNRMRQEVPTADVVVTNPTEYAIALKYDQNAMRAPVVVAKGRGPTAALIRSIAIENGVPIIERKPLARALYRTVKVGQEIPEELYAAVAEILAYVYELTGKTQKPRPAAA